MATKTALSLAPGPLALVQSLVNSVSPSRDDLSKVALVTRWLRSNGLLAAGTPVSEGDVRRLVATRTALKALLADAADAAAKAELNRIAHDAIVRVSFGTADARLQPAIGGVDGAIGTLLGIAYDALRDGSLARLKVCGRHECSRSFFDHSKNQSGAWCCTECGNVVNARAFRQRKSGV
jgi:predicted RNA-binding Zn ribbon-like protein